MAGKYGTPNAFLFVDGYDLIANKVHTLTHKVTALQTKSDGLADEWEEHSPIGVCLQELTQEGAFFDTNALKSHAALVDKIPGVQDAVRVVCLGFAGQVKGNPFVGFEGVYTEAYDVVAARGDLQKANVVHKVTGERHSGQIIQNLALSIPILTASQANPTVITTSRNHGISNGQTVRIAGNSQGAVNGDLVATVVSTTTFTVPVDLSGGGGTGGTVIQYNETDWDTEDEGVDYTEDVEQTTIPVTSSSQANPSIITTSQPHGFTSTQTVLIAGHTGSTPAIDGEHVATVITTTTFSIPVNVTVAGTGGTVVAADTIAGGYGFQQVTAFTGLTGFIGKIRDSSDDITYGDLITFADVTSQPAAERKNVAGTIDRFLSFKGDVTGTGVLTVFCGFSRS